VYRDVVVGLVADVEVDGVEFRCRATFPRRTIYRGFRVATPAARNYVVTSVKVCGVETLLGIQAAVLFTEVFEPPPAMVVVPRGGAVDVGVVRTGGLRIPFVASVAGMEVSPRRGAGKRRVARA